MKMHSTHSGRCSRRPAFTMTELLVTIGSLTTRLVSLVVAIGSVRETARVASTRAVMTAMSQATNRFREDTGYLPPVLDNDRGLVDAVPITDATGAGGQPRYLTQMQGWYSYTSPAEYLIGYGNQSQDGLGGDPGGASSRPGIRFPGADGVWGATRDSDTGGLIGCGAGGPGPLASRQPSTSGKVLGPYLELKDESIIGSLAVETGNAFAWDSSSIDPSSGAPKVFFPGEAGYDRNAPKVIVDAWGTPIRYYRRAYPMGNPSGSFKATHVPMAGMSGASQTWTHRPTLSEFIALRPFEIEPSQATDYVFQPGGSGTSWGDFSEGGVGISGDPTTTTSLQSGEFAFLSAGPDRRIFNWHRADYLDRGGNDGSTFRDWHGHHPGRSLDSDWFPDGLGGYCRTDAWYQGSATEEVNRDNIREISQ